MYEDLLGVLVHPRDRRAGQDVVELLREHGLPELVDLGGAPDAIITTPQEMLVDWVWIWTNEDLLSAAPTASPDDAGVEQ